MGQWLWSVKMELQEDNPITGMAQKSAILARDCVTLLRFILWILELDVVDTYGPRENLDGHGEIVVDALIRIVRVYRVRIRIGRMGRIGRRSRVTELGDGIYTKLVNVVTYDCELHNAHIVRVKVVVVAVPVVVIGVVLATIGGVTGEAGSSGGGCGRFNICFKTCGSLIVGGLEVGIVTSLGCSLHVSPGSVELVVEDIYPLSGSKSGLYICTSGLAGSDFCLEYDACADIVLLSVDSRKGVLLCIALDLVVAVIVVVSGKARKGSPAPACRDFELCVETGLGLAFPVGIDNPV